MPHQISQMHLVIVNMHNNKLNRFTSRAKSTKYIHKDYLKHQGNVGKIKDVQSCQGSSHHQSDL